MEIYERTIYFSNIIQKEAESSGKKYLPQQWDHRAQRASKKMVITYQKHERILLNLLVLRLLKGMTGIREWG